MAATTVSEAGWEPDVLTVSEVVIVAIWSSHRDATSRRFLRVVDDIAAALEGEATVLSVDIDHNPVLARRYGVSSLPTLLVFRSGELIGRTVGGRLKDRLITELALLTTREMSDGPD